MKDDEICPLTFGSSLLLFFFDCSLFWCIASLPPISSFFLSPPPRTSSFLPPVPPPRVSVCYICHVQHTSTGRSHCGSPYRSSYRWQGHGCHRRQGQGEEEVSLSALGLQSEARKLCMYMRYTHHTCIYMCYMHILYLDLQSKAYRNLLSESELVLRTLARSYPGCVGGTGPAPVWGVKLKPLHEDGYHELGPRRGTLH